MSRLKGKTLYQAAGATALIPSVIPTMGRDMHELDIAGQRVADDTGAYVIAELGHNHQGSLKKAEQLLREAAAAGANAAKLQKRDNKFGETS
jgi:acetylornithine/succinyldiaminopimelate/putrescine aminotransferase